MNFFSHFPRQRLRPYGEIKEATPDSIMVEKASKLNCEYIVRLAVALSEMADTVSSNVMILREALRNSDESKIIREVEKLNEVAKMFNTRSDLPVTSSDLHRLLKYAIDNDDDDSDETFDKMEHLGMLLYVIGSHKKQFRSLIRNPGDYSKKCEDLPVKHDFKVNGNLKSLKSWWASQTVTSQTKPTVITSSHRKNLLADLGSDTDSDQESGKRKRKKGMKRSQRALSLSSSSLSLSDDDPPAKKKHTHKKKQSQLELSEEKLGDLPGPSVSQVWSPKGHESKDDTTSPPCKKKNPRKTKRKKTRSFVDCCTHSFRCVLHICLEVSLPLISIHTHN